MCSWRKPDVSSTIGAGDTFIAGMMYAVIQRGEAWPLLQKLRFANEIAGRKVMQEGFSGLGNLMPRVLENTSSVHIG